MRQVKFFDLMPQKQNQTNDDLNNILFFTNAERSDITKVTKDTMYMVVVDVYGFPYIFNITKPFKKYTCGKNWSPKLISDMRQSLDRDFLVLDENVPEVENLDKLLKSSAQEHGYY